MKSGFEGIDPFEEGAHLILYIRQRLLPICHRHMSPCGKGVA